MDVLRHRAEERALDCLSPLCHSHFVDVAANSQETAPSTEAFCSSSPQPSASTHGSVTALYTHPPASSTLFLLLLLPTPVVLFILSCTLGSHDLFAGTEEPAFDSLMKTENAVCCWGVLMNACVLHTCLWKDGDIVSLKCLTQNIQSDFKKPVN